MAPSPDNALHQYMIDVVIQEVYANGGQVSPVGVEAFRWWHDKESEGMVAKAVCFMDDPASKYVRRNADLLVVMSDRSYLIDIKTKDYRGAPMPPRISIEALPMLRMLAMKCPITYAMVFVDEYGFHEMRAVTAEQLINLPIRAAFYRREQDRIELELLGGILGRGISFKENNLRNGSGDACIMWDCVDILRETPPWPAGLFNETSTGNGQCVEGYHQIFGEIESNSTGY